MGLDLPVRYNPSAIQVRPNAPSRTKRHRVYGHARGKRATGDLAVGPTYPITGQIDLVESKDQEERERSTTGDETQTRGHVLFKTKTLEQELPVGVTLKKGWVFVDLAGQGVDYVISELRFESYLRGSPLLLYADFERPEEKRSSE